MWPLRWAGSWGCGGTSGEEVKPARAKARTQQPESLDLCQAKSEVLHYCLRPQAKAPDPTEVYSGQLAGFWDLREGEIKSEGLKGISSKWCWAAALACQFVKSKFSHRIKTKA